MSIEAISNSEDPYDIYKALDPRPQKWEEVGRVLCLPTLIIAGGAFIPAALKKKRTYTQITPAIDYIPPLPPNEVGGGEALEPRPIQVPRCIDEERRNIEEVFGTIAHASYWELLWNAAHLSALGDQIEHVHPFSLFLAMPREIIRDIFSSRDSFKMGCVFGGVKRGMRREIDNQNIERYLPNFAAEMEKSADQIRQLIQAAEQTDDWQGLLRYLFDIPA